jgi:predicted ArsR family transcriptional regulator
MQEFRANEGNEKHHQMLQRVAHRLAGPYIDRVEGKNVEQRVNETATILEEQGCMADWQREENGDYFIDEYSCPFPKIAERDRAVCALHVEFVRVLTGADTRLTRSLMRGERACTYRIRPDVREEDVVPLAR